MKGRAVTTALVAACMMGGGPRPADCQEKRHEVRIEKGFDDFGGCHSAYSHCVVQGMPESRPAELPRPRNIRKPHKGPRPWTPPPRLHVTAR